MKTGMGVFIAAFAALGASWAGFVLAPALQLGGTKVTTLCSSQAQRGREARICVVNCITSRCRQVRSGAWS